MTSTYDQDMRHRRQRGRAKARPLPEHEAIVSCDEVAEFLIETFPASDPPSEYQERDGGPWPGTRSRDDRRR